MEPQHDEPCCAFCTAGCLAAHRNQPLTNCVKCREYTCYHHGDVVPVAKKSGRGWYATKEWHCYECSGRKDGKHVK